MPEGMIEHCYDHVIGCWPSPDNTEGECDCSCGDCLQVKAFNDYIHEKVKERWKDGQS